MSDTLLNVVFLVSWTIKATTSGKMYTLVLNIKKNKSLQNNSNELNPQCS